MINQIVNLPFGITVTSKENGSASIHSELVRQFTEAGCKPGPVAGSVADGIESLLLAMASAGMDMADPKLSKALNDAVEGIGNNLRDEVASTVVVFVDGGLIQDVVCDGEINVITVDTDLDGYDGETFSFKDSDGTFTEACGGRAAINILPDLVESVIRGVDDDSEDEDPITEDELVGLGYVFSDDPDTSGHTYFTSPNGEGSESFYERANAVKAAANHAREHYELSRCGNCGKLHSEETLVEAKDLAERVAPGEEMPSGECPDCGALCHLIE